LPTYASICRDECARRQTNQHVQRNGARRFRCAHAVMHHTHTHRMRTDIILNTNARLSTTHSTRTNAFVACVRHSWRGRSRVRFLLVAPAMWTTNAQRFVDVVDRVVLRPVHAAICSLPPLATTSNHELSHCKRSTQIIYVFGCVRIAL
jgi:hypothetical protein